MVDESKTAPEGYDPDAPPDRVPMSFFGRLTDSVQLNNADEADSAGYGENYRTYMEKASRPLTTPVWFLKAVAVDGQREDGSDFTMTDLIALQDKNGRWLTKGQTPDAVAEAFRKLGFTASYRQVGQPNSAVSQIFKFSETEIKLGRGGFTKRVSLFPVEHVAELSAVPQRDNPYPNPRAAEGSEGTPEAPPDASPEETKVIAAALDGKTRSQVFQTVMGTPQLKGIARVLGADLIQAATDESLPDLLIKAGYLTEDSGVLKVAA